MLVAEFRLQHPVLRATLEYAPDVELVWIRADGLVEDSPDQPRMLCWAVDGDLSTLEAGVAEDPTVDRFEPVERVGDRTLCRFELTERGAEASVYPTLVAVDAVVRRLTVTVEGWEFDVSFPGRDAFDRFTETCTERGYDVDLHRLSEGEVVEDDPPYSLTDRQHGILVEAARSGYLDIPRETSLQELGERLGVSPNAVSEGFRRGTKTLVENTLLTGADETADTTLE